jgi:hypothetical protein
MGFVYKTESGYVMFTGAKHRLTAAVVDITTRKPSHVLNMHLSRRIMQLGLRLAGVPAEKARDVGLQWTGYMAKSIDAQCDALVIKPFGQKLRGMLMAGFRDDILAEGVTVSAALLDALEAHS